MIELIVLLFGLILLSGFFSGAEVAIVSVSELKTRHFLEQKIKNAKHLLHLKTHPSKTLITILIGNNIVNIAASAIATKMSIDLFASAGVGIATGVMTFLILTFGEIIPKTFASKHSKSYSLALSPIIVFMMKSLYPLVWFFFKISKLAHRIVKADALEPLVTEQEVRDIVKIGEQTGQIKTDEVQMIHNIFRFDDISVHDIMTPRTDMFALEQSMTISQALPLIIQNDFSRVPVYEKQLDNMKGIVYTRHLLDIVSKGEQEKTLADIMEQPLFMPATMKINVLLKDLQKKKTHMAIVVDEYGGVEGIITIEDVLEELVGDIYDESDELENLITKRGENQWLILGRTQISDINETLGLSLSLDKDYNTIAGLLQSRLRRIPIAGDQCVLKKNRVRFIVKKVQGPVVIEVLAITY